MVEKFQNCPKKSVPYSADEELLFTSNNESKDKFSFLFFPNFNWFGSMNNSNNWQMKTFLQLYDTEVGLKANLENMKLLQFTIYNCQYGMV